MSSRFASSKNALAMCDVCGFQYKLRQLKDLVRKGVSTNIKAYPVDDPQAIRDPRPDTSLGESGDYSSRGIQWGWNPVGGGVDPYNLTPDDLAATGSTGQVVVVTS